MLTDATLHHLQVEKGGEGGSELVSFLAVAQRVRPLFFAPLGGQGASIIVFLRVSRGLCTLPQHIATIKGENIQHVGRSIIADFLMS